MITLTWVLIFLFTLAVLTYQRASLIIYTLSVSLLFVFLLRWHGFTLWTSSAALFFLMLFIPLNISAWRRKWLTQPLFHFYRQIMPSMSRTEKEAIAAGTITWEGDLFRGNPAWQKLLSLPVPALTAEEQAFMDGPVETLCAMINDWEIKHQRADLPEEVWRFIKEQGFFGLIIPKQYGGLQFSAYAHSQILIKISGRSIVLASTIGVPNSLGPAELLLHYGTTAQKDHYLPRLARGEEVPCFALTSPQAGSDAGSMTDYGIVGWGEFEGKKTLGIHLYWNKRYITLAPIATVIGLAFKLYDPEHLLGSKENIGVTCALIPRDMPGIQIGRRHFPLHTPFQNGPIQGHDVFIPVEWIIGGVEQAGKGWRMLMECLAAGRAITLPANSLGGAKVLCYATGAYARIRKQFNMSIGRFEGIEEPLARIAVNTYVIDAARLLAVSAIDTGEKPSVASAIVKYHTTELGRQVSIDAMDIHGGKGICLGPKNYIGSGYEAAPIAITVEGANILTRNMIIFGQGAIRCHPYVLAELEAAHLADPKLGVAAFDKAVIKHIGFGISNVVRTLILGLTSSRLVSAPKGKTKRYFQHATRFSSALALTADVAMLCLGSQLKRKESVSARLGDILSYLYLLSAVLKHYHDQGKNLDDLPIVRFACEYYLFHIQEKFAELIRNFPIRGMGYLLHVLIFPWGKHFAPPKDCLKHKIAQLIMAPTETRQRLASGAYLSASKSNLMADIQDALIKSIAAEPIEKIIKAAHHEEKIKGHTLTEKAQSALEKAIITIQQFDVFMQAEEARSNIISVDDFITEELAQLLSIESYPDHYAKSVNSD